MQCLLGSCEGCTSNTECPCKSSVSLCFPGTICRNTGSGSHVCESCPLGYEGDGVNCTNINEVSE